MAQQRSQTSSTRGSPTRERDDASANDAGDRRAARQIRGRDGISRGWWLTWRLEMQISTTFFFLQLSTRPSNSDEHALVEPLVEQVSVDDDDYPLDKIDTEVEYDIMIVFICSSL